MFRKIAIALFCSASVASAQEVDSIRIGGLVVLTGQYAMQGAAFREGMELAVEQANQNGGVSGHLIELRVEDSANRPMQALTAARKLIDRDHVVAAITSSYPELGTGAAEFQKKHIPVVHLWDSSPDIEAMGAALFGIGPWAPSSGEESARFAIDTLGAKRAVTFSINDPWSELVTTYFKEAFQKRGGVVEQSFSFNPQDSDFRAAFSRTRALAPDVVYSPISDNIVPFYTQLRQANLRCPVISSDVIAKEHIQRAPRAFEGIYQSQIKDPSGPEMERLAAAYQRKFGRVPGLPWYVAIGYDGVSLILYCVGKVGSSSPELTGCLAGIKDLPGVTQTFSFNAGGSSPQFERIFQIRKGAFLLADLSGS